MKMNTPCQEHGVSEKLALAKRFARFALIPYGTFHYAPFASLPNCRYILAVRPKFPAPYRFFYTRLRSKYFSCCETFEYPHYLSRHHLRVRRAHSMWTQSAFLSFKVTHPNLAGFVRKFALQAPHLRQLAHQWRNIIQPGLRHIITRCVDIFVFHLGSNFCYSRQWRDEAFTGIGLVAQAAY